LQQQTKSKAISIIVEEISVTEQLVPLYNLPELKGEQEMKVKEGGNLSLSIDKIKKGLKRHRNHISLTIL
jgi:hypothetical protein